MKRDRAIPSAPDNPLFSPPLLTDVEWRTVIAALRLTPQQTKIVALILHGKRDKQIAAEMQLNIWTVRTHLTRIFVRLGIGDRVELVVRVFATLRALPAAAH